ncbi:Zn-dependent exopeptidase [Jaminaea rosea]|uniref:Peptide hydrolase n=1 Tax=Jaminaea rosea TaxID=1569628 RepID=A0A316UJ33_9BASI|nr:Zn-dependent exopeptidase [Jaminaea rosea]PWN24878.1 Zn-dependent exopeptidase [Jaminaea rosea]
MRLPLTILALSSFALASPVPSDQLIFSSSSPATPFLSSPINFFASIWSNSIDVLTPRLVQTSHETAPYWDLPLLLRWRGIKFADVTDHAELGVSLLQSSPSTLSNDSSPFPSKLSYHDQVKHVHTNISTAGPRTNIKHLTSFRTRYYKSQTGRDSQVWLRDLLQSIVDAHQPSDIADSSRISVREFTHDWVQSSLIVHIPATNRTAASSNGLVIVSSHQDSVNLLLPIFPAPGADDDGSGTVTQIESLRALMATGWRPEHRDVEWHFYSAEEAGLLGSQAVVSDYVRRGVKVDAMSQFDMTAFVPTEAKDSPPAMGIVTDFVSPALTTFNKQLLHSYLPEVQPIETKCGYACSDHASWTKVGVHSAFTIENEFAKCNLKRIHTTRDVWDHDEYSFEHIARFSKLSSAFVVELSGWAGSK